MVLKDAFKSYFLNWGTWQSRSSRSEYWWGILSGTFAILAGAFLIVFLLFLFMDLIGVPETKQEKYLPYMELIINFLLFIGSTSLGVRRLHDLDKSAWWYLLIFVPLIGVITLLVLFCMSGTVGSNRYGPDIKEGRDSLLIK